MFIPYDDDQPKLAISPATTGLIAVNVIVFAGAFGSRHPEAIFNRWAFDPMHPGPVTWLASLFLHVGLAHLLGNMLFLWIAARPLEYRLGSARFLALYFAGGLVADLVEAWWSPLPTVGASGAIAALMGAYAILCPQAQVRVFYYFGVLWSGIGECSAFFLLGFWVIEQALFLALAGPTSHVGYAAHLGGFGAGLALALLVLKLRLSPGVSLAVTPTPAAKLGASTIGAWKKPLPLPRRRDDSDLERLERASARASVERALRRGNAPETVRRYEHAELLSVRPVLSAREQWELAVVLLDHGAEALGLRALEDLVRVYPRTEEARSAWRVLQELRVSA